MHSIDPQEAREIAEKVRSGEFFQEGRQMYDLAVHDPMSERYFYVLVMAVAALVFLLAYGGMQALYPLEQSTPFIFTTEDNIEDVPQMKSLLEYRGEDPNEALVRFYSELYVMFREEYNIDKFDRDSGSIVSLSSPEIAQEYLTSIDRANPDSPIRQYQSHSRRRIVIDRVRRLHDQAFGAEVTFQAIVEGRGERTTSRWQANLAFDYKPIELDDRNARITPPAFTVTRYQLKRLQDVE